MGVAAGGLQPLALTGNARRRLLWLPLTTLGVWLAFPFGYAEGFAVSLLIVAAIAVVAPELGGGETILAVAIPIGALAGGVLVGARQSPLVRDRALCESFFGSLGCELLDRSRFATRETARIAIFDWLETWYNPRRRHSALDYLAPLEYERRWQYEAAIT